MSLRQTVRQLRTRVAGTQRTIPLVDGTTYRFDERDRVWGPVERAPPDERLRDRRRARTGGIRRHILSLVENFRSFESGYRLFLTQGTPDTRDLRVASFFLFVLRRLVFALAEHPERNRDEQNQYAYHEQVRYPL